jgi:hypothetical protein
MRPLEGTRVPALEQYDDGPYGEMIGALVAARARRIWEA